MKKSLVSILLVGMMLVATGCRGNVIQNDINQVKDESWKEDYLTTSFDEKFEWKKEGISRCDLFLTGSFKISDSEDVRNVTEYTLLECDKEYKMDVADFLFDNRKVYSYEDIDLPKEEINRLIAQNTSKYDKYGNIYPYYMQIDSGRYEYLYHLLQNAGDEFIPATFDENHFVCFDAEGGSEYLEFKRSDNMGIWDGRNPAAIPENVKIIYKHEMAYPDDEPIDMDKAEAKFIEILTFFERYGEDVLTDINVVQNGIKTVVTCKSTFPYCNNKNIYNYSQATFEGRDMVEFTIYRQYKVIRNVENVELLSPEFVLDAIRTEIKRDAEGYISKFFGPYTIDTLYLDRVLIPNENNYMEFSLVPAWRADVVGKRNYEIYINAIDGSIIKKLGGEVWERKPVN